MKIIKIVITLLGSIHSLAMHTAEFCHCTPVCNSELELYYKIQLFGLFSLLPLETG